MWYIDYPGAQGSPRDRAYSSRPRADHAAMELYRTTNVAKVVVCNLENARRVGTVVGSRSNPRVENRD